MYYITHIRRIYTPVCLTGMRTHQLTSSIHMSFFSISRHVISLNGDSKYTLADYTVYSVQYTVVMPSIAGCLYDPYPIGACMYYILNTPIHSILDTPTRHQPLQRYITTPLLPQYNLVTLDGHLIIRCTFHSISASYQLISCLWLDKMCLTKQSQPVDY